MGRKNRKPSQDDAYNKDYDTYQKVSSFITVGSGAIGLIGEGITGLNRHRASKILEGAQKEFEAAYRNCENANRYARQSVQYAVSLKKQIMKEQMMAFLRAYKRLHPKISFGASEGLNELSWFIPAEKDLKDLSRAARVYARYNEKNSDCRASNVALVMVQEGTVERISDHLNNIRLAAQITDKDLKRTRQDELKIECINVLAEFSTASIEFAIGGIADALSSMREVNEAKRYASEYRYYAEQLHVKSLKMEAIGRYAEIHWRLLKKCQKVLKEYVPRTINIIREKDGFFHFKRIKEDAFTKDEFEEMTFTLSLVGAVKAIIDSPIIARNGEVYTEDNPKFKQAEISILNTAKNA